MAQPDGADDELEKSDRRYEAVKSAALLVASVEVETRRNCTSSFFIRNRK